MANEPDEGTASDEGLTWESAFIANMRNLREAANISQSEMARWLADRGLPFHQQTVQRTEAGTRPVRLNEAMVIAELLGEQLSDMMRSPSDSHAIVQRLAQRLAYYLPRLEQALSEGAAVVNDIDATVSTLPPGEAELIRAMVGTKFGDGLLAAREGLVDLNARMIKQTQNDREKVMHDHP